MKFLKLFLPVLAMASVEASSADRYLDATFHHANIGSNQYLVAIQGEVPYAFDCLSDDTSVHALYNLFKNRFGFQGTKEDIGGPDGLPNPDLFPQKIFMGGFDHPIVSCDDLLHKGMSDNEADILLVKDGQYFIRVSDMDQEYRQVTCFDFYKQLGIDFDRAATEGAESDEPSFKCVDNTSFSVKKLKDGESGNLSQVVLEGDAIDPVIFSAKDVEVIGRQFQCDGIKVDEFFQTVTGIPTQDTCSIDFRVIKFDNTPEEVSVNIYRLPKVEDFTLPAWIDSTVNEHSRSFFISELPRTIDFAKELYPDRDPADVVVVELGQSGNCNFETGMNTVKAEYPFTKGADETQEPYIPGYSALDFCTYKLKSKVQGDPSTQMTFEIDVVVVGEY